MSTQDLPAELRTNHDSDRIALRGVRLSATVSALSLKATLEQTFVNREPRAVEAIGHFRSALRLNPNLIEPYSNLAAALAAGNRPDEAIATARRGIEVAHATGQQAAADSITQWLTKYQASLQRTGPQSP